MPDFYAVIKITTDHPDYLKQAVEEMVQVQDGGFTLELITTGESIATAWQNCWPSEDGTYHQAASAKMTNREDAERFMEPGDLLIRLDTIQSPVVVKIS